MASQSGAESMVAQAAVTIDARTLDPRGCEEAAPGGEVLAFVEPARRGVAVEPGFAEVGQVERVVGIDLEDVVDGGVEVREGRDVDEAARVEVERDLGA